MAQAGLAVLKIQKVEVVNPATSPVPVHEQGTANVNVTNPAGSPVPVAPQGTQNVNVTGGSVAVGPPAAVTSGGQRLGIDSGVTRGRRPRSAPR